DAYWDAYSWFLRTEAPFPSIADVAYVGGYPLLIVATFVLARGRARPRLTDVLDSAVVATGALILVWALLVEPLLAQTGLSAAGMVVTVATPVLDVVLLVGVVQLALRKGVENPALRFLVVGVTCQVVMIADSLSGDPIGVVGLSIGSIVMTFLVGARLVLLQQERNRMLAAVDVGREKYRELFEQADESRAALAVQNERLRELDHLKD